MFKTINNLVLRKDIANVKLINRPLFKHSKAKANINLVRVPRLELLGIIIKSQGVYRRIATMTVIYLVKKICLIMRISGKS
jgi:hypothetical protein